MSKVLIPKTAGALSAVGGVFSDAISEFSGSIYTESRDFDFVGVNNMLRTLFGQGEAFFERNRIEPDKRAVEVWMEGRYPYQVWEIPIRIDDFLTDSGELDEAGLSRMVDAFHAEHEKAFAVREETAYVECVFWRLKAIGKRGLEQRFDETDLDPVIVPSANSMKGTRRAYFREAGGMVDTPLYLGLQLNYGNVIEGPAVIVEPTTTIAIQPTYVAEVTRYGNYLIKHGDGNGNGNRG